LTPEATTACTLLKADAMGLGAEFFLEVGSTDLDALKVAVELVAAVAAAPSFWKNLQI